MVETPKSLFIVACCPVEKAQLASRRIVGQSMIPEPSNQITGFGTFNWPAARYRLSKDPTITRYGWSPSLNAV